MRQAGRVLPEYRALKAQHSFLELVRTPELAAEVTLQPIRRFDFDAAILFSDILVVPEALGRPYDFREGGGIEMKSYVRSRADVERLQSDAVPERLHYVGDAIRLLKRELADRTALIGFSGSPWTLANFMLKGDETHRHGGGLRLFRDDRATFELLGEKLTAAVTNYLRMQIDAGVDAVQIFDSHGELAPPALFRELSAKWMQQIVEKLCGRVPVIVFSKGANSNWNELIATGANVIGVDWNVQLAELRNVLPASIAIQGNLRPSLLVQSSPHDVSLAAQQLIEQMRGRPGYIFNLGHGVPPDARLDCIAALVDTVRSFR
jgi:uroporphyrinogen decarboxylase